MAWQWVEYSASALSMIGFNMMNKICTKCKETLSVNNFNRAKNTSDRLYPSCKECRKKLRGLRADKRKEYDKKYHVKNKEKRKDMCKNYYYQDKERVLAHSAVTSAIRSGKIKRPDACERCKEPKKTEAHHFDYSKPLEIEWLCRSCHTQLHIDSKADKEPPCTT